MPCAPAEPDVRVNKLLSLCHSGRRVDKPKYRGFERVGRRSDNPKSEPSTDNQPDVATMIKRGIQAYDV
ncbi:hypothetical protein BOX15_Mlig007172g1 [Macrostomum lignano]|nr:hypothetical protein BOX15_Mlig007172g1 [Macrostomum lignano]